MRPTRSASLRAESAQPHAHDSGLRTGSAWRMDERFVWCRHDASTAAVRAVQARVGRAVRHGWRGLRSALGRRLWPRRVPVGRRLRPPKRQRGPHRWRLQRSARSSPLAYIRYGRGPHRWRLLRSARPSPLACVTVRARRSPLPATLSSQLGELTKSRLCTLIRVKRERSSSRYRERTSSTRCRSSCPVRRAWRASAPRRSRRSRRFREPRG